MDTQQYLWVISQSPKAPPGGRSYQLTSVYCPQGFPGGAVVNNSPANRTERWEDSILGWGRSPWRRKWQPTPIFLPGKFHGQRSLVGCSLWGHYESDTTERLPFHFSFSCIGEGNGNPLQCSCLENPRDGGAWWASVFGVAQSRTRLKWLSSSSSNSFHSASVTFPEFQWVDSRNC